MFVGEGPGQQEDWKGRPFVGWSGDILERILTRLSLERFYSVYITNAVKCRPPDNRDPWQDEIKACAPYLHAQIYSIRPQLLVGVGRFATNLLAATDDVSMGELSERDDLMYTREIPRKEFRLEIPVLGIYHPAYLGRQLQEGNPDKLRETFNSLRNKLIGLSIISEK
jgi:DNA polymerase